MPKLPSNLTLKKATANRPTLVREISVTLILKFLLIYCIWWLFFSNPVDEQLNDTQVQNVIFGAHPTLAPTAPIRNPVEDQ